VSDQADTSRTEVSTYVPAYQKDEWRSHATELDMSQSEFVRTMVQAGRSKVDPGRMDGAETKGHGATDADAVDGADGVPSGEASAEGIERAVIGALEPGEYISWDELLDAVVGDVERRLEDVLTDLQRENRVQYSGRHGGYTLQSDEP
jgi:hypothetical protein